MPRVVVDEIGHIYGQLTVIKRATPPASKRGQAVWACRCACGNDKNIVGAELRDGLHKSCGCRKYAGRMNKGRGTLTHGNFRSDYDMEIDE